ARVGVRDAPVLEHTRSEPLVDEAQQHPIEHPAAQDLPEASVIQRVEELAHVDVEDPPAREPRRLEPESLQRLMRGATRPEAVRAVQEVLLVDGLQHHRHRALQDLVLEGRDADRARLRARPLRDVDPPHGRRAVRARLRAVEQRPEVVLQVRRVLLRGLPIHARRAVLARAPVRLLQPVDVDVVGERCERHAGRLPRPRCYPFEFRGDGGGARRLRHLSLERGRDPVPPFARWGPSGRFPHVLAPTAALRLPGAPASLACALLGGSTLPWRRRDLPGSWRTPPVHALFSDPGGIARRAIRAVPVSWRDDVAFRVTNCVGSRNTEISRLIRTTCTLTVYASQPGSPLDHARLASGWWPTLAGRGANPLGSTARFPLWFATSSLPPRPGFAWRTSNLR